MNRKERRKKSKKPLKQTIRLDRNQISAVKHKAVEEAIDEAFIYMLAIPAMVIHDKYPLLMRKEVDGKKREERFVEMCLDLYDSFQRDYVTIEELREWLDEETGVKIRYRKEN